MLVHFLNLSSYAEKEEIYVIILSTTRTRVKYYSKKYCKLGLLNL